LPPFAGSVGNSNPSRKEQTTAVNNKKQSLAKRGSVAHVDGIAAKLRQKTLLLSSVDPWLRTGYQLHRPFPFV